jgi:cardiolipin synthase
VWYRAWAGLLLAWAGCQAPCARFAPDSPCPPGGGCSAALARQLTADSAVELACHPLRAGLQLTAGPAGHLLTAARGAIGKHVVMPLTPAPGPVAPGACPLDVPALDKELTGLCGQACQPACLHLYPDGQGALAALEQVIASATCRLDVLMFQWENDCLGAAIADRLAAKAGPRLRVRVLVDGGGNLMFGCPEHGEDADVNGVVRALAQRPYVEVLRTRNPFARFDHRKLVIADGRLAWTGGRNFTDKAFFGQRDLSLLVAGPLAGELQDCFEHFWCEQGGKPASKEEPIRLCQFQDPGKPAAEPDAPAANALARLVCTGPLEHQIERVVYRAVDRARQHVYLENFSVCDSLLVYKLARARRRGVEVRVVLTLSSTTDSINCCNRVTANRLLAAGVRVYIHPAMVHTKAAAVDGCWAYVGTGNFDPLSFRHNRELGLAVSAGPLIDDVEQRLFQVDFCPEWELKKPLPASACDYAWEVLSSFCL